MRLRHAAVAIVLGAGLTVGVHGQDHGQSHGAAGTHADHMEHSFADVERYAKSFDDPGVRALWKVAVDEGITIDLFLMQYGMIESAAKMMREFPSLTYGFCHCMDLKPGPNLERDLKAVLDLSRFKNLHAKVDFIGTGTQRAYPCDDLHDAAMQVIRAYGPERCLWTSSYPNEIWTPKITYAEHLKIFTEALPLRDSERKLILGENARKIWFKNSAFL